MTKNDAMKYRFKLRIWQFGLLAAIFIIWWALTKPGLIPAFVFDNDNQAAFFFGEPLVIFTRIWEWFVVNADIYAHLWTTLVETILAFAVGTVTGGAVGMWLALSPFAAAVADPFIKGLNSMPRVILAPIFAVWFGLGIASKVALGVTLVFFIVFFNVYQGVREVNPNVLASARMLGANRSQLLKNVYLPSAMSWVFSSLHTSVGMAFVGAVVGEYLEVDDFDVKPLVLEVAEAFGNRNRQIVVERLASHGNLDGFTGGKDARSKARSCGGGCSGKDFTSGKDHFSYSLRKNAQPFRAVRLVLILLILSSDRLSVFPISLVRPGALVTLQHPRTYMRRRTNACLAAVPPIAAVPRAAVAVDRELCRQSSLRSRSVENASSYSRLSVKAALLQKRLILQKVSAADISCQ